MNEVLNEFPQLQERLNSAGGSLSGGEQQMLAIGRALMANPTLILMDEPSEGLAPKLIQRVEEIVRSLRDSGLAILLVEQKMLELRAHGCRQDLRHLVGELRLPRIAGRALGAPGCPGQPSRRCRARVTDGFAILGVQPLRCELGAVAQGAQLGPHDIFGDAPHAG